MTVVKLRVVKLAALVAAIATGIVVVAGLCTSHGHVNELLIVTVRIVDRQSGSPLEGALVATVRYRGSLGYDWFQPELDAAAMNIGKDWAWRMAQVAAARTTAQGEAVVRSSVYVTRYRLGPLSMGMRVAVPDVLLIDHPRLGRTIVNIDTDCPIREGTEPNTWQLDLGTIAVPQ